jgi:hypothetical protein
MDAQGMYSDSYDFGDMTGVSTAGVVNAAPPVSGGSYDNVATAATGSTHHHTILYIVAGIGAVYVLHRSGIRSLMAA